MTADLNPQRAALAHAGAVLRAGASVCYPTETVYGLGALIGSADALAALAALKGRDAEKAFSVLVPDAQAGLGLLRGPVPSAAMALAEAFWPGPLTIVAPAADGLDPHLVGARGGVGLRCSSDPYAAALVAAAGQPITSTSANPAGANPAESVAEARAYFGEGVAAYIDGGLRSSGFVSTVVEVRGAGACILRTGAIGAAAVAAVVELVELED